ncbi:hypothetical protein PM082_010648 [Marasmius tenuissimus]|nr:hypothetical protein PM082_010648 [Marasmius tenuissimus]
MSFAHDPHSALNFENNRGTNLTASPPELRRSGTSVHNCISILSPLLKPSANPAATLTLTKLVTDRQRYDHGVVPVGGGKLETRSKLGQLGFRLKSDTRTFQDLTYRNGSTLKAAKDSLTHTSHLISNQSRDHFDRMCGTYYYPTMAKTVFYGVTGLLTSGDMAARLPFHCEGYGRLMLCHFIDHPF